MLSITTTTIMMLNNAQSTTVSTIALDKKNLKKQI